MRNDFLTIPDAPNYEINSEFICRNKKTGHVLKLAFNSNRGYYYSLCHPHLSHSRKHSPKSLRAQAVAAAKKEPSFAPIPSLGGKYEINNRGVVRNAKKKIRIPTRQGYVIVYDAVGKRGARSVADLLWETHGRIIPRRHRPCPCSAGNDSGKVFFDNLAECARFLAPKVNYSASTIEQKLYRRDQNIFGWNISYLDRDPRYCDHALAHVKSSDVRKLISQK